MNAGEYPKVVKGLWGMNTESNGREGKSVYTRKHRSQEQSHSKRTRVMGLESSAVKVRKSQTHPWPDLACRVNAVSTSTGHYGSSMLCLGCEGAPQEAGSAVWEFSKLQQGGSSWKKRVCVFLSVHLSVPRGILSLALPVSLSLLLPAMNGHLPSSIFSHWHHALSAQARIEPFWNPKAEISLSSLVLSSTLVKVMQK